MIQGGEHSSVTDARATMALYRKYRVEWEKTYGRQFGLKMPPGAGGVEGKRGGVGFGDDEMKVDRDTRGGKGVKRKRRSGGDDGTGEGSDSEEAQVENGIGALSTSTSKTKQKKKNDSSERNVGFPGGGRRGVSSGLSVVVKRRGGGGGGLRIGGRDSEKRNELGGKGGENEKWWQTL